MASEELDPNRNWNNHEYDEHAEIVAIALNHVNQARQRGERPNLAAICRETGAPYDKTRRRVLQQDAKQLRGGGTYKQAYLRMKKQLESQTRAIQAQSLQNLNHSQSRSLEFQQYVPPRMPSPPTGYKGNGGHNKAMTAEQEQAVLEMIWQEGIKDILEVTQAMVMRFGDEVFARDHNDPNTAPRKASLPWGPRFVKRHAKTLKTMALGTPPDTLPPPSEIPAQTAPARVIPAPAPVRPAPVRTAPVKAKPVKAAPVTVLDGESDYDTESASPPKKRQRIYVHCPFRLHAQVTGDLSPNDCAGHYLEGKRLVDHLKLYHISRLPCPGCGADTSELESWKEIGAFARKHYDFGCRTPPDWTGYPDLSLEQICEIPDRISIDVTIAFRSVWRGTFRGVPIPAPSHYTCGGRWDCIGFDHINAPEQGSVTLSYPERPETHKKSRQQDDTPDTELWSETSDDDGEASTMLSRFSATNNARPQTSIDSDSGIQMQPPPQDPKSLAEEALLERLAGDVDELRRRLGMNMARRLLNGFLAPNLFASEPSEPPSHEERPETVEPARANSPRLIEPKIEESPVINAVNDIDMDDDWSEASSPVEGYMKGVEDETLPSAPWMTWTKKPGNV